MNAQHCSKCNTSFNQQDLKRKYLAFYACPGCGIHLNTQAAYESEYNSPFTIFNLLMFIWLFEVGAAYFAGNSGDPFIVGFAMIWLVQCLVVHFLGYLWFTAGTILSEFNKA